MDHAEGQIVEVVGDAGHPLARLVCTSNVIPSPGQYLLACQPGLGSSLSTSVFPAGFTPDGFLAAPPLPINWTPGMRLLLQGPYGHGFSLPPFVRRVVLFARGDTPARLLGLVALALEQSAAVVLVSAVIPSSLPADVEVQAVVNLPDLIRWADYLAIDTPRGQLHGLRECLGLDRRTWIPDEAQVLVFTPMPCGMLAECGVCAVPLRRGHLLACKDGPVFPLAEVLV